MEPLGLPMLKDLSPPAHVELADDARGHGRWLRERARTSHSSESAAVHRGKRKPAPAASLRAADARRLLSDRHRTPLPDARVRRRTDPYWVPASPQPCPRQTPRSCAAAHEATAA